MKRGGKRIFTLSILKMTNRCVLTIAVIVLLLAVGCSKFPKVVELEPVCRLGALNTVEVEIKTNLPTPSRFFVSICPAFEFCSDFCETAIVEVSGSSGVYVSSLGYRANYRVFVAWLESANPWHKKFFDSNLNSAKLKSPALIQKVPDGSYQVVAETFFRFGTIEEEFELVSNRLKLLESRLSALKRSVELLQSNKASPKRLIAISDELEPLELDPFFPQLSYFLAELVEKTICARDVSLSKQLGIEVSKSGQNCLNQAKKSLEKATGELGRIKSCRGFQYSRKANSQ